MGRHVEFFFPSWYVLVPSEYSVNAPKTPVVTASTTRQCQISMLCLRWRQDLPYVSFRVVQYLREKYKMMGSAPLLRKMMVHEIMIPILCSRRS